MAAYRKYWSKKAGPHLFRSLGTNCFIKSGTQGNKVEVPSFEVKIKDLFFENKAEAHFQNWV